MTRLRTLAFCLLAAAVPASAVAGCNHPGTPSRLAILPHASYVELWFTNGASEGKDQDLYFDLESTEPTPDTPQGADLPHYTTTVKFGKIAFNDQGTINVVGVGAQKQYCFRMWTRLEGPQGCRSEQPTAVSCVTTTAYNPNEKPTPYHPNTVQLGYRTVDLNPLAYGRVGGTGFSH